MAFVYYSRLRPLSIGCYPTDRDNLPVSVEDYSGCVPVFGDSWKAWGSVTYRGPLPESVKERYGFFDKADADGTRELERRVGRIANAVARKTGASIGEIEHNVLALLSDSDEAREMSDREISHAMIEFYGTAA